MPHAVDRGQVLYAGARPRYYAGRFRATRPNPVVCAIAGTRRCAHVAEPVITWS